MIFSTAVVASVLSLISCSRAAIIHARQDDCMFVCPDEDLDGSALYASTIGDAVISCTYGERPFNSCTYDPTSGTLVGDGDCPENVAQQCNPPRIRWLKEAVDRRGVPNESSSSVSPPYSPPPSWSPSPSSSWKPSPSPSWSPSPSSSWGPSPPPSWSPSPSKSKPSTPSPTPQPCNFRCPQQDLAKKSLTDEAIRDPYLYCSYSTPHCRTCSFCKYNTETGLLLEDNDDGDCPKTASAARPWDRRYA